MSAAKRKRPTRASRAAAAARKDSNRPTTRAGRAARRKVDPALLAAVGRASRVKGMSQREIDRLPDAQLKRTGARAGNDFHITGDEIKPGLGTLPAALTSAEIRDLRHLVNERLSAANPLDPTCPVDGTDRFVPARRADEQPRTKEGTIAALISDVMFAAGEVNGIAMLAESIADKHLGFIPEQDARGTLAGNSSGGTLAELHSHIADLNTRIQLLGAQVRRFNAL